MDLLCLFPLRRPIAGAACAGGADTCVGVGREWARLNAWAAASRSQTRLSLVISLSNLFILLLCSLLRISLEWFVFGDSISIFKIVFNHPILLAR